MAESTKNVKDELKSYYGGNCMLTMLEEKLTYHHIIKDEDGGLLTVENGALLNHNIHKWLTKLECKDPQLYDLINLCLKLYKVCVDRKETELIEMYRNECVPLFQLKISSRKKSKHKKAFE